MRLICPNCSAQYEIDVTLVPDEGRDVQCSNCGHTWFELPPPAADFDEAPPVMEEAMGEDLSPDGDEFSEPGDSDEEQPSQAAVAIAAATEDDEEDTDEFYGGDLDEETSEEAPEPRRPADAAALGILREEAERELSQRRAPPSEQIETQTDLGLDEIRDRKTPTRALRARMAHLNDDEDRPSSTIEETDIGARPTSQAEVVSDADYQEPRRDLLPDIDEINSTLNSTGGRQEAGPEAIARHRSGFRTGFITMVLIAIAMILAYAQAPAIARAFPASETAILTYVDKANGVRDWIDGLIGQR